MALNDVPIHCRSLVVGHPYRVLDFTIKEEHGIHGPYKKAIGIFKDSSKPGGRVTVHLPNELTRKPPEVVELFQQRIASGRYPTFTVLSVTSQQRSDNNHTYDKVEYVFK